MTTRPRAANGRSKGSAPPAERAIEASEILQAREGTMIPGTSMVLHRFNDGGSLHGVPWIDADGLPVEMVNHATREIAAALSSWVEDQKLTGNWRGANAGMFDRNAYVPPDNIFEQMRMARRAVENDDVVGGLADGTEGMAINEVHWESEDLDDADIFNQWSQMVDLDSFIRGCWQELFESSQYVAARWWGFKDFTVRGRTSPTVELPDDLSVAATQRNDGLVDPLHKPKVKLGNKRRTAYNAVYCPLALTILDSTKVVPVGTTMFGMEQLAWRATREEVLAYVDVVAGKRVDEIMRRFFLGKVDPNTPGLADLKKLGIDTENLLLMNPSVVWRHTLSRPNYKPWSNIRLKRIFRLLDQKQQLMNSDRVALIGNANYILLVKKGEKENKATTEELSALNEGFQYIAKLPVVIGDHTLSIEIIAPKTDFTLEESKYDTINNAIMHSILLTIRGEGSSNSRGDTTLTVGRAIARGLANRRRGIGRDWEQNLGREIVEHPFNAGKFEGGDPNLAFSPRRIALDMDQAAWQALVAARASGDVSRRTYLEELELDQDVEAARRMEEDEHYDPIFKTATPFNGNSNPFQPDGGPGNSGGGALPPGQGGGGRPPAKKTTPASPSGPRKPRAPRGQNRSGS